MTCEVENCTKKTYRNNICQMHFERFKRHGKYELPSLEDKFWKKVKKTETCWIWTGAVSSNGYGNFGSCGYITKWNTTAHRFSFTLKNGKTDLFICHTCDVKTCVNPDHLFAGSPKDNSIDMVLKGRHWNSKKHPVREGIFLMKRIQE